jgi:hypothetical protein
MKPMDDDLLPVLRAKEQALLARLEQTQLFRELETVRQMIEMWLETTGPSRVQSREGAPVSAYRPKAGTQTAEVLDAAEGFLKATMQRAKAREIVDFLVNDGVVDANDDKMVRTVASYLSSAKDRFDNVRSEGYGLVGWAKVEAAPASAPAHMCLANPTTDSGLDICASRRELNIPDFLRPATDPEKQTTGPMEEPAA